MLEASGHARATSVLVLSAHPAPDFLRETLVHGLRSKLGPAAVDFVKAPHLYAPLPGTDPAPRDQTLNHDWYGHGFTYARRLRDDPRVDRSNIAARIADREFDLIVYASVHRGLPFFDAVTTAYGPDSIAFVDGEDEHGWSNFSAGLPSRGHYFMREMPDGCPPTAIPEGAFWL